MYQWLLTSLYIHRQWFPQTLATDTAICNFNLDPNMVSVRLRNQVRIERNCSVNNHAIKWAFFVNGHNTYQILTNLIWLWITHNMKALRSQDLKISWTAMLI